MFDRIDNVKPLSMPRTHGHTRRRAEQWLVLIGEGSNTEDIERFSDDIERFCRDMWPEAESVNRADSKASAANERPAEADL